MTTDNSASSPAAGGVAERTTKDLAKAAVSGWLGTALEFMDFQLYSPARRGKQVPSKVFFPGEAPGVAVISSMATYATGYLSRPLGAWYFGRLVTDRPHQGALLHDRLDGRRHDPDRLPADLWPGGHPGRSLLVVLRLAQGFGAGAEIAAFVGDAHRVRAARAAAQAGSLVALGTNSGTLGASAIWGVLVATMSTETVVEWGWRIPFIASALIMLFAVCAAA